MCTFMSDWSVGVMEPVHAGIGEIGLMRPDNYGTNSA